MSVQKALRPVRRRLRQQRAVAWGCVGLMVGAIALLLVQGATFLYPIEHGAAWGWCALGLATVVGLVLGWLWPVSMAAAARHVDSRGLMARVQTALENEAADSPMLQLQQRDAKGALEGFSMRDGMPLRASPLPLGVACACMALWLGLSFVPSPQRDVLLARADFRQEMTKQAELVEAGAKTLDSTDEKMARETRKILGDLARELRRAENTREALSSMDQAQRRLEALRQQNAEAFKSALAAQGLAGVAEALDKEDAAALSQALEQQEGPSLQEALENAAASSEDQAAGQALQNAAAAAGGGSLSQVQAALQGAMAATGTCTSQGSALVNMTRVAAARAGQQMASTSRGSNAQAQLAVAAQGGGQGKGAGSNCTGQGSGSGAGQGSTHLDGGYQSSGRPASQGGGAQPKDKLGEYEAIYDPTRLGGEGELQQEKGAMGQGETTEAVVGPGMGTLGESVPYAEVAYQYQQAAVQAVESADVPIYVQKWVETYFQSLLP